MGVRWALVLLLLLLSTPGQAAEGASLLQGRPCRVEVGRAPVQVADPCWASDGDASRTLPEPLVSCRVLPDRFAGLTQEVCVQAPVRQLVVDLGRYRPLGVVESTWDDVHDPPLVALEVSADGVTWEDWGVLAPLEGDSDRLSLPPVYARLLRARALLGQPERDVLGLEPGRQPETTRDVDDATGLVRDTGERPRDAPQPLAEVSDYDGSLLGLTELVVRAPVAPERDDEAVALRAFSRYEVLAIALLAAVARLQVVVLRRPVRAPAAPGRYAPVPPWPAGPWARPYDAPPPVRTVGDVLRDAAQTCAVLAGLAVAAGLASLAFVVVPLIGLAFLVLVGFTGLLGLAACAAGVLLLGAALAAEPRPFPRRTSLVLAVALVLNAGALALFDVVDDSAPPVEREVVDATERPVPADADPLRVVRTALALAEQGDDARACALLAPRAREGCAPSLALAPDVAPRYVGRFGDRVLVQYDSGTPEAVVRLERSRRGWELLDVPGEQPSDGSCVDRAVQAGEDPFRCEVGGVSR